MSLVVVRLRFHSGFISLFVFPENALVPDNSSQAFKSLAETAYRPPLAIFLHDFFTLYAV